MKIIRPVTINDATFVSSNVAENDHPEYNPATTYNLGDKVMVTTTDTHTRWESLINSNTGVTPGSDVTKWLSLGSTNRWAMWDAQVNTQTTNAEEIEVVVQPGVIDAIALFGLEGTELEVTMTDPLEGVVYNKVVSLINHSGINNWYAYFTEPITRKEDLALFDLPRYGGTTVTVNIRAPGATAKCGMMILGLQRKLGLSSYGSGFGTTTYSKKEVDEFGNVSVTKRKFSKRASVDIQVARAEVDEVIKLLTKYRDEPIVWEASPTLASSLIYGFYKDFNVVITYWSTSNCVVDIEGLI